MCSLCLQLQREAEQREEERKKRQMEIERIEAMTKAAEERRAQRRKEEAELDGLLEASQRDIHNRLQQSHKTLSGKIGAWRPGGDWPLSGQSARRTERDSL